jgi:alanyl-tRNA synthetase
MHLGDEINTVDVDSPGLNGETLLAVEEAAADAVEEDRPVIIHLCPPGDVQSFPLRKVPPQGEEVIRVVEIGKDVRAAGSAAAAAVVAAAAVKPGESFSLDFSPCCGTHCKSTGQIGALRILGAEKYKGMTRLSFIAGRRVLRDSRLLRDNADLASRSLKVPLSETGKGVLALLEKAGRMEREIKALEEAAAETKAAALLEKAGFAGGVREGPSEKGFVIIESYPKEGMEEVLRIGRAAQKNTGAVLVLASEREFKFAAFCSVKGFDLSPLIREPFDKAGGRGGGGPSFFQGLFNSAEELSAFLAAVKAAAENSAGGRESGQ